MYKICLKCFIFIFFTLIISSLSLANSDETQQSAKSSKNSLESTEEPYTDIYGFSTVPADNSGGYISIYSDHIARRVGDIITIIIDESSKASKTASTKSSKKSEANGSLNDLFGLSKLPLKMGTEAGSDYSGSGTTARSGNMEAKISAFVKRVLPNGNLVLEGSREVTVNDDIQVITICGIARPQDINLDNTILSIYLADAKIKYSGEGIIAQRPGIITKIIQTPFRWIASIFRRLI